MALAHIIGNAVEAVLRRGDPPERRRDLMSAWAMYCAGAGNVVAIVRVREA